jgi:hypothetical protein
MPLSVLMPAPVSTTIRRAASIHCLAWAISVELASSCLSMGHTLDESVVNEKG